MNRTTVLLFILYVYSYVFLLHLCSGFCVVVYDRDSNNLKYITPIQYPMYTYDDIYDDDDEIDLLDEITVRSIVPVIHNMALNGIVPVYGTVTGVRESDVVDCIVPIVDNVAFNDKLPAYGPIAIAGQYGNAEIGDNVPVTDNVTYGNMPLCRCCGRCYGDCETMCLPNPVVTYILSTEENYDDRYRGPSTEGDDLNSKEDALADGIFATTDFKLPVSAAADEIFDFKLPVSGRFIIAAKF